MIRRHHLLYVLAALAVPIPAFATGVVGGGAQAQPLNVAVSLDECGIASTTVVCKLDATFNSIDGARYYTAAVTGPDGSVVDYGNVSSGATSLWVPYVGDGSYTVSVSAWGEIPKGHKPKPLATDSASAAGSPDGTTSKPGASAGHHTHHADVATHAAAPGHVGADASTGNSNGTSEPSAPADPGPPVCTPEPAEPPPPSDPTTPADPGNPGGGDTPRAPGLDGVSSNAAASMAYSGELPTDASAPDCPDPQTTADGTCCPTTGK